MLANHDDTTEEHVQTSALRGVKVAKFPTTVEAAAACRKHGISIMIGAPNLIHGGSHSGNVSALELAELDLLDVVSSDYVPAALFKHSLDFGLVVSAGWSPRSDEVRRKLGRRLAI